MSSKKKKKDNRKNNAPKKENVKKTSADSSAETENIVDEQEFKAMFAFEPENESVPETETKTPETLQKRSAPKAQKTDSAASADKTPQKHDDKKTDPSMQPPDEKADDEKRQDKPLKTDLSKPAPESDGMKGSEQNSPITNLALSKPAAPVTEKKVKRQIPKEEPSVQNAEKPVPPVQNAEKPVPLVQNAEKLTPPVQNTEKPAPPLQNAEKPAPPAAETHLPENDRFSEAEDLLDRDLARAQRHRERELKREEVRRSIEEKNMEEQLEKAKESQKRAERAAALAAKREREKEEQEAQNRSTQVVKPLTKEKDPMRGMNIMKGITVLFVVAGIAYAGGLIYAKTQNDTYIETMEKELMGIAAAGSSDDNDRFISDGKLSADEKKENGLTLFLPDTDKDGLSDYYEINVSNTDPKNSDTDNDDSPDGAEILSGLNPLSNEDSGKIVTNVIESGGAKVVIEGKAHNAFASIDPVTNNSILGATGIVGDVYEFYTVSAMQHCTLTLKYDEEDLEKLSTSPDKLSIFKFNSDTLTFDKLESTVDPFAHTVSADIDSIGIYTIGNTAYIQEKYNTQIFFLIDNSGSMYSQEECPGSEENDLEFKRLDFAENLIDRLGDSAEYGAAKFTGTYTKISPITGDREGLKAQIDSIRDADKYFDGTEIASSLSNAVDELGDTVSDRNYIVLLTDGYPTNKDPEKEAAALQKAIDKNITVFTIGLGKKIDSHYLTNIAESTNGQYFQVSNAAALETICDKIESFMSYNKTTVSLAEDSESTDVYIIADSGFNVAKDSLAYNNFRTDFSEKGTDYGIAELTRAYYTGELSLKTEEYTTDSGDYVNGYDLTNVEQLVDGKPDLVDLKIDYLDVYNEYLALKNKWNYRASNGGLLKYTQDTTLFLNEHGMSIIVQPYTVQLPEMDRWFEMLQSITFQKLPEFSSYECAIITSSLLKGTDWDIINAFCYMQRLHDSSEKCDIYDFGYHGDEAFDRLTRELKRGNPVVISIDGAALNAVRLLRESENTNKIVLEAYDCNNLGSTTYITLLRTPIYDGSSEPYHQYSASVRGKDMSLKMYITK